MTDLKLVGIDIAKNVFQLYGVDMNGKKLFTKKLKRCNLTEYISNMPICTIVMEAGSGANHWYRKFTSLGHNVKIICPRKVKPYAKEQKNDHNDAAAICEAASRPNMVFVAPKTIDQQDIQMLHRIRARLKSSQTEIINHIRGLLAEYGIIIPQGRNKVRLQLISIIEDNDNELSSMARDTFYDLYQQLIAICENIKQYDKKINLLAKDNPLCKKIEAITGVGLLTASAIVANVGDAKSFKNGRHMSAYFGLVPRQDSSGGKTRMLGITKSGNKYIRTLLVHGARSAIYHVGDRDDKKSMWINKMRERCCMNKVAVALANKHARIIWAILSKGEDYDIAA